MMKLLFMALPCLFCSWFYRGQAPNDGGQTPIDRGQAPIDRGQTPFKWGQTPNGWGQAQRGKYPILPEWPDSMPVFGQIGENGLAMVRRDGNSTFVGFIDLAPPANVLDRATTAFLSAGWEVAPISTSDMLLFTRGESVAAVLAENYENGARVTAIQRLVK